MGGREKIVIAIIAVLLIGGVIFNLYQRDNTPFFKAGDDPALNHMDKANASNRANETGEVSEPEKLITVHVVGAVNKPGIYNLPEGARVHDAVQKAGGASEKADVQRINMARPLFDGEQIILPERMESGSAEGESPLLFDGAGAISGGKININRASVSELTALNGIGESRAKNIVAYREENGPFKTIEDIMNVPNIGTGIFSGIKEDITVY